MDATLIWGLAGLILLVYLLRKRRAIAARKRERDSLRYDSGSGCYFWMSSDGTTVRSKTHPDDPGGAWNSENSGGGGGFWSSDGFDGGGDGGGGD